MSIHIDIITGHFRLFSQGLFQDKKKNQKAKWKLGDNIPTYATLWSLMSKHNLCALSETSYVPQLQESRLWGSDRWGHLLVKGKTWLQTVLGPEESEHCKQYCQSWTLKRTQWFLRLCYKTWKHSILIFKKHIIVCIQWNTFQNQLSTFQLYSTTF